jgi:hypothetical protein
MGSRWYTLAVVVLWLTTMSWLVRTKVVPPMVVGEPPSYETLSAEPPTGWWMSWNGQSLGWAISTRAQLPNQMMELRSRVRFDRLSLDRLLAAWPSVLGPMRGLPSARLNLEAESVLTLDPLRHLVGFDSALRTAPGQSLIRLQGTVDGKGKQLELSLRMQDSTYELKIPLWSEGMLDDSFSPQTRFEKLRAGQRWTVPSYNPLLSITDPAHPIEILLACVEESAPIVWNGRSEEVWWVVYRTDPSQGPGNEKNVRTRLWVRPDGTVLRQQFKALGGALTFNRMSDAETARWLQTGVGDPDVRSPAGVNGRAR